MSRKELLSEPFYFINQILSLRIKKLSFFALRANRSIDRDQREDESRPLWLIKAERSEVVHQRARSDLSFHWLGGGGRFSRKLPIVRGGRDERGGDGTSGGRVIAIRFLTCAQSSRALSLLRHRSIVGISNADFFQPTIPEMTGCDSDPP